jgi:hypothetical protein
MPEEEGGAGRGGLVSQLKLELDNLSRGVGEADRLTECVYVIGATNEVALLDPDLLRPGRSRPASESAARNPKAKPSTPKPQPSRACFACNRQPRTLSPQPPTLNPNPQPSKKPKPV